MKKFVASALAALTLLGAAAPAFADDHRHRGWHGDRYHDGHYRHYDRNRHYDHRRHHHDDDDGEALAAGIVGLALGAIIGSTASSNRYDNRYYNGYNYGYAPQPQYYGHQPYYGGHQGYYQGHGPRFCTTRERVWDPYLGRRVWVERRYRC